MTRTRARLHVGVGGPVGSGKTALIEALAPHLVARGDQVLVVTNDIVTTEDAEHVRRTLAGVLPPERVVGVETGTCPHSAVREDPSGNLLAVEELETRFPNADWCFVESGGDNLTLSFSPALVDVWICVVDVAGGEKIPRKRGPGLIQADLLVINKIDLADLVGARLEVMARDAADVRDSRPTLFTNCKTGEGIDAVIAWLDDTTRHPPEVVFAATVPHGHSH
jgi:urease accessory protein